MALKSLAAATVLASIVALGPVACGGDEPASQPVPHLSKAQFVARTGVICAQTDRKLEAAGGKLSRETSEATFVERDVAPIFRDSLRRIAALRPPAADQPTVRGILAAGRRGLARLEANPESLKAPPGSAKDPFREFGRRAEAYGLHCGG